MEEVGKVTHFYNKIMVAVVELNGELRKGDMIKIKGKATDFDQELESMQIEHETIDEAGAGDAVGMKVEQEVKSGDIVYKL
jgi:putative protease